MFLLAVRRSRGRFVASLVAAAVAAGVAIGMSATGTSTAASTGSAAPDSLSGQLSSILASPQFDGAESDLTVRDLDTDQTLFDQQGSTRLLPASNAKLLTSTAAMDVLGPSFRFATAVRDTGSVRHGVLNGNLYLKGYGDPMETPADYDALAASVARAGIRNVRGSLVADDTYFDNVRLAPFWSWDDEPYYYSAQTSALNVSPDAIGDTGTALIFVYPASRAAQRPKIVMTPANHYLQLHVTATTGVKGSAETINAVREYGRNVVDITGSIPVGASMYAYQPTVDNPTAFVAQLFAADLAKHGVRVHSTRFAATPAGAHTVATHESQTLSSILTPFLKLSNNMIAEALTKAMGQKVSGQGTWAAGTAAILADNKRNGVDTSTVQLFDGSGLGRADYVPSDQIVTLLSAVRSKSWYSAWYNALPIAGESGQLVGGTLADRMKGTAAAGNLHGKTGSMTGVSALSGYVTDKQGHHLAFSMITNNFVASGITSFEDAVGETLANYDGTSSGPTPSVVPALRQARQAPRDPAGPRAQLECSWTHTC